MGEEQRERFQVLITTVEAKQLHIAFRIYNEKFNDFHSAAANALNNGEAVDGWASSPAVAEAGKLVGSLAVGTAVYEKLPTMSRQQHALKLSAVTSAANRRGHGRMSPHSCVMAAANAMLAKAAAEGGQVGASPAAVNAMLMPPGVPAPALPLGAPALLPMAPPPPPKAGRAAGKGKGRGGKGRARGV